MSFRQQDTYLEIGIVPAAGPQTFTPLRMAEVTAKPVIATSANNENRATTNAAADEAEEGYQQITAKRRLRGAGTPGAAPPEDALLRAAQLKVTPITGVAGTSATYANVAGVPSLTWAAAPATTVTAGAVLTIGSGTGAGQRRTIAAWDAAAKKATLAAPFKVAPDAGSKIDILPQRVYSASPTAVEQIAAQRWARNSKTPAKSKLHTLGVGMTTFQATFAPGKAAELSYTIRGVLAAKPAEVAWVDPMFAAQAPIAPKLLGAELYFGGVEATRMYQLTIDHGATLDQAPDVGAAFGYADVEAMEHKTGGQFTYEMAALSADDPMADFLSGKTRQLMLIMGTPGNGFAVTGEATITSQPDESNQRGRLANQVSYRFANEDLWYHIAAF